MGRHTDRNINSAMKKKEIHSLATTWTNHEYIIQNKMRQTQKDKYRMIPLNEVPRDKVEWWVSGVGREGNELLFNRLRVSARAQENIVEVYSGGSCTR